MTELKHIISTDHVTFSVEDNGKLIPVDQWKMLSHIGCDVLLDWAQSNSDDVIGDAENVKVNTNIIATLSDDMIIDLELPKLVGIVMHLQTQGVITSPEFRFSYQWQQDGRARPIAGAKRIGCFLQIGNECRKLPSQLFKIANAVDKINATLPEKIQDRLLFWSEIESYLPEATKSSVTVSGFLNSTKVYFANAFELTVQQTDDGIDFDPVLLRSNKSENKDFYEDDINFETILTAKDQEQFAALFRQHSECRTSYPLGQGKYIIFSEHLHKALEIVRAVKSSSLDTKLDFLKNPKALLAEKGIPEDMLENVFSDRVEGYGERRIKVIPWVEIKGQSWFPDDSAPRGLCIGDQKVSLSQKDCSIVEELVRDAIQKGKKDVNFDGIKIPADHETLAMLAEISPAKPTKKSSSNIEEQDSSSNVKDIQKFVLYVKENWVDIKYCPKLKPRTEASTFTSSPPVLKSALDPHQFDGVKWLVENYRAGVGGVLLADDMGLGKTFQSLAFLAWLQENMLHNKIPKKPIMIVAPTGLLKNWEEEHGKHIHEPGLGCLVSAYGAGLNQLRDRSQLKSLVKPLNAQKLKEADWILTTYETLSNYQTGFAGIQYAAVVFDEMQKIKTPNIRLTEAAQALHADFILGMTGTPIENRLGDLWCLVDTLQPARLGTLKQFSEKYEKIFSEETSKELKSELTDSINGLPPLMLRRMKEGSLKGLPKVHYHYIDEPMSKGQAVRYMDILDSARNSKEPGRKLEALQELRRISLHPDTYRGGGNFESFISESARLRATFRILDEISKKKEKVLIFIEYREWLQPNFLPAILKQKYGLAALPMVISGEFKNTERQKRVNKFQEETDEFDIMLLSPKAGGVGLTLTQANHVIHLSRWWNPAVEDQCTGRAYRKGQKKDVHVYYPLARHPELGDKSFDYSLKQLIDIKKKRSSSLLIPPLGPNDADDLMNSVFSDSYSSAVNASFKCSIDDIHRMEPHQFEDWVESECRQVGLIVKKTPKSWDAGADLIIEDKFGDIVGIIQCKHSQQGEISFSAIDDLLRAKSAYASDNAKLIAVTNARFNLSVNAYVKQNSQIRLVTVDEIHLVGAIAAEVCL